MCLVLGSLDAPGAARIAVPAPLSSCNVVVGTCEQKLQGLNNRAGP